MLTSRLVRCSGWKTSTQTAAASTRMQLQLPGRVRGVLQMRSHEWLCVQTKNETAWTLAAVECNVRQLKGIEDFTNCPAFHTLRCLKTCEIVRIFKTDWGCPNYLSCVTPALASVLSHTHDVSTIFVPELWRALTFYNFISSKICFHTSEPQ